MNVTDADKERAEKLLAKFQFKNKGMYLLGCTASLLNIHAQQQRAFNLIWALLAQVTFTQTSIRSLAD